MHSPNIWFVIVKTSAWELLRSRGLRGLFATMLVFGGLGLAFPVRLGQAGPAALAALVAVQVLASILFAGTLIALPMSSGDWSWSSSQIGALPLQPRLVILALSLGQGLVWFGFWLALLVCQGLGLALQWAVLGAEPWGADLWWSFATASVILLAQGLWVQAMARFLATLLPGFLALLALLVVMVIGHFLGSQTIDPESPISWFRPGLEYLSQDRLLSIQSASIPSALALALCGFLGFNLLCAWILGWKLKGLAELDPKGSRD